MRADGTRSRVGRERKHRQGQRPTIPGGLVQKVVLRDWVRAAQVDEARFDQQADRREVTLLDGDREGHLAILLSVHAVGALAQQEVEDLRVVVHACEVDWCRAVLIRDVDLLTLPT